MALLWLLASGLVAVAALPSTPRGSVLAAVEHFESGAGQGSELDVAFAPVAARTSEPLRAADLGPHFSFTNFVGLSAEVAADPTADRAASLGQLVTVCAAMFVPLAFGWCFQWQAGNLSKPHHLLLPLTFCAMLLFLDLMNQSLSVWTRSPMGITAFQSFLMTIGCSLWMGVLPSASPELSWVSWSNLMKWAPAGLAFVGFQLVNHQVSFACSLSERVVLLNICPAAMLAFETLMMPVHLRQHPSRSTLASLVAMVFGAVLFASQYPDFTPRGLAAASLLVCVLIPYRLTQRWLVNNCGGLSVPFLCSFDGLLLVPPSMSIMEWNADAMWNAWALWLTTPFIVIALVMSSVGLAGSHAGTLYLLQQGSATTFQVYYNMANFVLVVLGVVLFHDRILEGPLMIAGIAISLGGGVAYAVSTRHDKETLQDSKLPAADGDASAGDGKLVPASVAY